MNSSRPQILAGALPPYSDENPRIVLTIDNSGYDRKPTASEMARIVKSLGETTEFQHSPEYIHNASPMGTPSCRVFTRGESAIRTGGANR